MRYPGAVISEPTLGRSIGIQGVWFNRYCAQQRAKGLPVPSQLSDVPRADVKAAKAEVAELAQTRLRDLPLTIRPTSYVSKKGDAVQRLGAFTDEGELLGLISPDSKTYVAEGQRIVIKFALAADGNMRAVWEDPSRTPENS